MDEMPGMSFGHAGTIVEGKEDTATEKIARLAQAGIAVAERIEDIPGMIQAKIAERAGAREGARHEGRWDLHRRRGLRGGASDAALAAKLSEACPVDIFAQADDGTLELVERNLDECVLCGLCLTAAPEAGLRILKLYDGEAALALT